MSTTSVELETGDENEEEEDEIVVEPTIMPEMSNTHNDNQDNNSDDGKTKGKERKHSLVDDGMIGEDFDELFENIHRNLPGVDDEDEDDETKFSWVRRPRQRQRWGETQILPHVDWGDLFFDLFYVGGAYNLGLILVDSPTLEGLLYFVGCFGPLFNLRDDELYYDSRFTMPDDVLHKVMESLQFCFLSLATLHIRPVSQMSSRDNIDMLLFATGVSAFSLISILRYLEIAFVWVDGDPSARIAAIRDARGRSVNTVFYITAAILAALFYQPATNDDQHTYDDQHSYDNHTDGSRSLATEEDQHDGGTTKISTTHIPIIIMLSGYLASQLWASCQYLLCLPADHKRVMVPMHISFTIRRVGEWTLLMLGESVLSLLIVVVPVRGWEYQITFYAGILSVILLQYLHFRANPHHPDDHALRKSHNAGYCYSILTQYYSFTLVVLGASFKLLLLELVTSSKDDDHTHHRQLEALLAHDRRFLADMANSGISHFTTEERRERIAIFFCSSMALIWFFIDLIMVCHKEGLISSHSVPSERTPFWNVIRVLFAIARVGIVVSMASFWRIGNSSFFSFLTSVYEPEILSLVGLVGIILRVILSIAGDIVFPSGTLNQHANKEYEPVETHIETGTLSERQMENSNRDPPMEHPDDDHHDDDHHDADNTNSFEP